MSNIYIKKPDGSNFYDIKISELSYRDDAMGDVVANGNFVYKDTSISDKFTGKEYVLYMGEILYLVSPPIVSKGNRDKNGMTTYDCVFVSDRENLKNIFFTDEALVGANEPYRNGSRDVLVYCKLTEFIQRINAALAKNAPNSGWNIRLQEGYVDKSELTEISLSNAFISDAIRTIYEKFNTTFVYVGRTVYVGTPVIEVGHVFGQGKNNGLKRINRKNKGNKIITRIAGNGSDENIPYPYPLILDENGEVIHHQYTRPYLMPSVYVESVRARVLGGSQNPIIDYYDAVSGDTIDGEPADYKTLINKSMPNSHVQVFDEEKPTIEGATYNGLRIDEISSVPTTNDYDDSFNIETGEFKVSVFELTLRPMGFDIYAQMAAKEPMSISMKSGEMVGATFGVAIDEEQLRLAFYDDNGAFRILPDTDPLRKNFPDSTNKEITVKLFKDNSTFGSRIVPNPLQKPKSGDRFVVLNIEMPKIYVDEAQKRLDNKLKRYMKENNFHKLVYDVGFDEFFLEEHESIRNQISTNALIAFRFNNEIIKLPIQSINVTDGNSGLKQYDITLTDEITVSLNSIGTVSNALDILDREVSQSEVKGKKQAASFYAGLKKVEIGLFDADGNNRIKSVEALAVKANVALIGQTSSNFSLQNVQVTFDGLNRVNFKSGTLFHYEISRSQEYDYLKAQWNIQPASIASLEADKDYYIYIQANRVNDSAIWYVSDKEIVYNSNADVLYFLWGQAIVVSGERKAFDTYGLSAILGGFLNTQQIKSPNFSLSADSFTGMMIDLISAKMYVGDGAEIIAKALTFRQPDGTDVDFFAKVTTEIEELQSGKNIYVLDLDSEYSTFIADQNGIISSGLPKTNKAYLYFGTSIVEDVVWSASFNGCSGYIDETSGVITITSVEQDSAEVLINALFGETERSIDWQISKLRITDSLIPNIIGMVVSADKIQKTKNGVINPSAIKCNLYVQSLSGIEQITIIPNNYSVKYSINGGQISDYNTIGYDISTSNVTSNITFYLYYFQHVIEVRTIPVLSDGIDGNIGESVYTIDLSSDNTSVPCDSYGNVLTQLPSTEAILYYGSTKITEGVIWNVDLDGMTVTSSQRLYTVTSLTKDLATLKITAKIGANVVATATWSVSKVRAGVDGQSPVIMELVPEHAAINRSGELFTPSTTSCNAKLIVGGESELVGIDAPIDYKGRNLFLKSKERVGVNNSTAFYLEKYDDKPFPFTFERLLGKTVSISFDYDVSGLTTGDIGVQLFALYADGSTLNHLIRIRSDGKGRASQSYKIVNKPLKPLAERNGYFSITGNTNIEARASISNVKVEFDTPTPYSQAPEDAVLMLNGTPYTIGSPYTLQPDDSELQWALSWDNQSDTERVPIIRDGRDGKDGSYTMLEYKVSAIKPSGEGSATPPTVPSGQFLWMRTGNVNPPASVVWSDYVKISGEKGETGSDGKKQPYYDYKFGYSTATTTATATTEPTPAPTWSDTPPNAVEGQYLWQKVTYYSVVSNNWVASQPKYSRISGVDASADLAEALEVGNLVRNGGFYEGINHWRSKGGIVRVGSRNMIQASAFGGDAFSPTFNVPKSGSYVLSFIAQTPSNIGTVKQMFVSIGNDVIGYQTKTFTLANPKPGSIGSLYTSNYELVTSQNLTIVFNTEIVTAYITDVRLNYKKDIGFTPHKDDAPKETIYLSEAIRQRTSVDGGLINSSLMILGSDNTERAGIDGTSSKVGLFLGGSYQDAISDSELRMDSFFRRSATMLRKDGAGHFANGKIRWDDKNKAVISGFSINDKSISIRDSLLIVDDTVDSFNGVGNSYTYPDQTKLRDHRKLGEYNSIDIDNTTGLSEDMYVQYDGTYRLEFDLESTLNANIYSQEEIVRDPYFYVSENILIGDDLVVPFTVSARATYDDYYVRAYGFSGDRFSYILQLKAGQSLSIRSTCSIVDASYYGNIKYTDGIIEQSISIKQIRLTQISNVTAICNDGIIIVSDGNNIVKIKNTQNGVKIIAKGLPKSQEFAETGQIYTENGFLKVKQ